METSVKPNVLFEVFDFSGNKVYKNYIKLEKNHDEEHYFRASAEYPDGIIIYKFTFDDGSFESITTIKN